MKEKEKLEKTKQVLKKQEYKLMLQLEKEWEGLQLITNKIQEMKRSDTENNGLNY